MATKTDNVVKLKNGLNLGYAEYGPPDGQPVMSFHGLPSSRLELSAYFSNIEELLGKMNVRMIAPDRPGIGLSDWRKYNIADYPDEMVELADHLGLDKFGVFGVSSGPKFVAACAWKIPERLTGATMVSSTAPFDIPGVKESYKGASKMLYTFAARAPWLLRLMLAKLKGDLKKDPDPEHVLELFGEMPEVDLRFFNDTSLLEGVMSCILEAFRQGTKGATHDFHIEAIRWGFDLDEIKMPVQIYHGALDVAAPTEGGRILAEAIPNATYKEYPEDGHSLAFGHFEEFLSTVL